MFKGINQIKFVESPESATHTLVIRNWRNNLDSRRQLTNIMNDKSMRGYIFWEEYNDISILIELAQMNPKPQFNRVLRWKPR
jgi:hypothetical protein